MWKKVCVIFVKIWCIKSWNIQHFSKRKFWASFKACSKGQKKSKWFFQVDVSSKKQTNRFYILYYYETSGRLVFVCFLDEIEDTNKTFWNYLTFTIVLRYVCKNDKWGRLSFILQGNDLGLSRNLHSYQKYIPILGGNFSHNTERNSFWTRKQNCAAIFRSNERLKRAKTHHCTEHDLTESIKKDENFPKQLKIFTLRQAYFSLVSWIKVSRSRNKTVVRNFSQKMNKTHLGEVLLWD